METQIKLKQVTSNDGKELIQEGDRVITIKIVNDKEEIENPEEEPEEEPEKEQEEPKDEVVEDETQDIVKDDNVQIPQTGQTRILYIIIGIIIAICLIVLVLIIILGKKKEDKDNK